jgi:hypothetical protein
MVSLSMFGHHHLRLSARACYHLAALCPVIALVKFPIPLAEFAFRADLISVESASELPSRELFNIRRNEEQDEAG